MKLESVRKSQRGVVLIVVVGVLAVLSLLAATFGMIARLELAVSRNQTEHEMAREAAHAGAQSLLSALQSSLNGGAMTSGALPDFLPNIADTDGTLLYRRDGVKVYMAVSDKVATSSATPDWLQGLGPQDAGMFNINAMGFANDLGSNCNPDIRYTSFDCSLVRLLTSRFATVSANDISNVNGTGINDIRGAAYPSFANANEQQRVAILLSRAIIYWRYGPAPGTVAPYNVPYPGAPGTEERRLGHLPRWNSRAPWSSTTLYPSWSSLPPLSSVQPWTDTGVGYPNTAWAAGGPIFFYNTTSHALDWGWSDGFPSLYLNVPPLYNPVNVPGPTQWSYTEPGVWSSFQGPGSNTPWGNDQGLPYPGLFWGKVSSYAGGVLTADNARPGWRDWYATQWSPVGGTKNYYVYFATGPAKWWCAQISGQGTPASTTLTLTKPSTLLPLSSPPQAAYPYVPPWATGGFPTPLAGDTFCIFMPSTTASQIPASYDGLLMNRWSSADANPEGDLVPNAMFWADTDGTLATEGNVYDLMVDNNSLLDPANYGLLAHSGYVTPPYPGTPGPPVTSDSVLNDSNKNWKVNALAGYVVHLYAGPGKGQVRTIQSNTVNQLTIGDPVTGQLAHWDANNLPNMTTRYRIEYPDDDLPSKFQPNNLQGNNRLYLSLGDLRDSVIVPALGPVPSPNDNLPHDGLTTAQAQQVADILMPYFLPYLSVSTQAIQASQSLCSINDWATDGVDNDANGLVDDPGEAQYEQSSPQGNTSRASLANRLYNGLGLRTWAHADPALTNTRVRQAAQLVANIIDFRDPGDTDTLLTNTNLNESTPLFAVYGAKGLHVTQIMPSPDPTYSNLLNGGEMQKNYSGGNNPGHDWAWNPGGWWEVVDNLDGSPPTNQAMATFVFSNLAPGYYALRLIGVPNPGSFTLTYNSTSYTVPLSYHDPGGDSTWYTGFVRKPVNGQNPLVCFDARSGSITLQLQADQGAKFRGFALLPQYIQLTNIAVHDIPLTGWTVTTDQVQATPPINTLFPITLPTSYTRAVDGKPLDLQRIPGATTTGVYPINYGTYVICMCEEVYEKQWTARSTANGWPPPIDPDFISTLVNGNGLWGDAPNEAYPVFPAGDISDYNALALLLGTVQETATPQTRAPSVLVQDTSGNTIAGAAVDGAIPPLTATTDPFPLPPATQTPSPKCYSSIEKRMILQPTWDIATSYWDWNVYQPSPMTLSGSQNRLVSLPSDPRIPAASAGTQFRSCLNKNYTNAPANGTWGTPITAIIWDSTSTDTSRLLATPASMAQNSRGFPLILNRPYPTTGWLGLVPTSNTDAINVFNPATTPPDPSHPPGSWRTIDPNPNPPVVTGTAPNVTVQVTPPATPEQLLGTLMSNATVGGVYARFNINTAPEAALDTVFRSRYVDGWSSSSVITAVQGTQMLQDTSKAWPANNGYAGMVIFVDSGAGSGQTRMIIPESPPNASRLMVNRAWDTSLDNTSHYRIMDSESGLIICAREQRAAGVSPYPNLAFPAFPSGSTFPPALARQSWANWDELLNDPLFQYSPNALNLRQAAPPTATNLANGIGFYDAPEWPGNVANADAGAGTYADGFPDSSNERKEWFMRFSNLFTLQSTSFQFTVAGLVFRDQPWDGATMQNNEPVAVVRIEMNVDLSTGTPSIVHFRYLTQ